MEIDDALFDAAPFRQRIAMRGAPCDTGSAPRRPEHHAVEGRDARIRPNDMPVDGPAKATS